LRARLGNEKPLEETDIDNMTRKIKDYCEVIMYPADEVSDQLDKPRFVQSRLDKFLNCYKVHDQGDTYLVRLPAVVKLNEDEQAEFRRSLTLTELPLLVGEESQVQMQRYIDKYVDVLRKAYLDKVIDCSDFLHTIEIYDAPCLNASDQADKESVTAFD
jgi:hypothetical protein